MPNTDTSDELLLEAAARVAHEVNRAYCLTLGDESQAPWEATPEILKDSVRSGVKMVLKEPWRTPEESHNSWMTYKLKEGWRYGPEKDLSAKEHPCLLPYSELPPEQKMKDENFLMAVRMVAQQVFGRKFPLVPPGDATTPQYWKPPTFKGDPEGTLGVA